MPYKCCVIGHPVKHSLSPAMHNAGYKELGLDFHYEAVDVAPNELGEFMKRLRSGEFLGVSVTVPHKRAVLEYANVLSPNVKAIEAANTLFCDNGKIVAENTDWFGVHCALDEAVDLKEKTILVYGAGGAARACLYALRDSKAKVLVTNRTIETGVAIANEFDAQFVEVSQIPNVDILINATSVGLDGDDRLLVCPDWLKHTEYVFDMVYTDTVLEQMARDLGCKIISGKKMLLYQGAKQFELFTHKNAPLEVMARAVGI